MTCCDSPRVKMSGDCESASCECGFRWAFDFPKKGKFTGKTKKWTTAWFCSDDYDRGWRLRGYTKHEVVGTRRRGNTEEYVVACSKFGNTFGASTKNPPDQVYCPSCEREGLLGPMLQRYRTRKAT